MKKSTSSKIAFRNSAVKLKKKCVVFTNVSVYPYSRYLLKKGSLKVFVLSAGPNTGLCEMSGFELSFSRIGIVSRPEEISIVVGFRGVQTAGQ